MANRQATGKKAKHGAELIQRTRSAVLNTFGVLDQRGKKISDLLADEAEKNPIKFMELASKLIPKEHNVSGHVEQTHYHIAVSEIDQRISELTEQAASGGDPKALPH